MGNFSEQVRGALRERQQAHRRRLLGRRWATVTYDGEPLDLVFTTTGGRLARRHQVQTALVAACGRAGIDAARVGTHTGRRSTVTALYAAGVALDDIARHVGHANPETTAGYVQDLGIRPADTARRAAALLDPNVQ